MKDLFETPEKLPIEVQNVLNKYGEIETYDQCKAMLKELKPLGYTFDYGLDAQPFDLQKLKEFEVYKNGTQHATVKAVNLRAAKKEVFSWFGEVLEVHPI